MSCLSNARLYFLLSHLIFLNISLASEVLKKITFIKIDVNSFTMGRSAATCNPLRIQEISMPFEMMKFEVTQEQYYEVMKSNPSMFSDRFHCPEGFEVINKINICKKFPVENITHSEAIQFAKQLTEIMNDGYEYLLPTEIQWEYAVKAGTTTSFWYGDQYIPGIDVHENESVAGYNYRRPREVGYGKPNPWGFYNMHGNVRELMIERRDCSPEYPLNDQVRWTRGGDFFNAPWIGHVWETANEYDYDLRIARSGQVGLRLVRIKK